CQPYPEGSNVSGNSTLALPGATPVLVAQVVAWQGIARPHTKNTTKAIMSASRPTSGGPASEYTGYTAIASGLFTLPAGVLPPGARLMRMKGLDNRANGSGACAATTAPAGRWETGPGNFGGFGCGPGL